MSQIIQHYSKPELITVEEAKERIDQLTSFIKGRESYYRRDPSPELLLLENDDQLENDEQSENDDLEKNNQNCLEHSINWEIYYYESAISNSKKEEEEEEDVSINETDERMDALENKLSCVQDSVYQIICGIFNKDTQQNVLSDCINQLYEIPSDKIPYMGEIYEESRYPTTRQGDKNEEEIKLLKQEVEILKQQVSKLKEINHKLVNIIQDKIGFQV